MKILHKGFNYSQDGPGNRLVYHLQGCNFACKWCSNADSIPTQNSKAVDYTVEEGERFSLDLHVKPSTPPMFIWHTYTDRGVHIHNATSLMEAYIQNGIPFEAHIFPKGPHGMSLANEVTWEGNPDMVDPHVAKWIDLSVEWVNAQ